MDNVKPFLIAVQIENEIPDETFDNYLALLPEDHRNSVMKYKTKDDRDRALLGALLIRFHVSKLCSIPLQAIVIHKNKYGKPYLPMFPDIHFNLSHSGNWVVFIIGEKAVGVDAEQIKEIDISAAASFFSSTELQLLSSYEGHRKLECFYDLWTLKESYIKALGEGLSIPLDSFWIELEPFITVHTRKGNQNWHFKQYALGDAYKLSVCSAHSSLPEKVTRMTSNELLDQVSLHVSAQIASGHKL
ncbi:4'-phosphopantetheinyl transferase family protein [Paenibacillus planticolens]|nr:4'-phosphopantetheinyl transferase superfamily protein [Paenibacillus planticolens]